MPIKILERMYNSSPQGLSQVEETKRLGLRGGESGGRLPHCLAMAVALHLPEPRSPGPYQWQGTEPSAVGWPQGQLLSPSPSSAMGPGNAYLPMGGRDGEAFPALRDKT